MDGAVSAMKVLVTGGAGYVGSHGVKALVAAGHDVVVIDTLERGHKEALRWGAFEECDIADRGRLDAVLARHKPQGLLHYAAYAYVGESMSAPLAYYRNNVEGTRVLLEASAAHGVKHVVFSSSCAVYGDPSKTPMTEDLPHAPVNPYGETKSVCERMIAWAAQAHGMNWMALRYFNASGADPDGEIGERHDPETHLIPLALRAASGGTPLKVFGADYPTPDGTAVRDYIHVSDLATAHVKAIEYLGAGGASMALNLGTGAGVSVREVIDSVRRVTGSEPRYSLAERRAGDPPALYADPARARATLGWMPRFMKLDDIVATAWAWEKKMSGHGG